MASHPTLDESLHHNLLDRKERLQVAIRGGGDPAELGGLLSQVDAALQRFEAGSFGVCTACHEAIEEDRIASDPLIAHCLDCLTEEQRRALESDLRRVEVPLSYADELYDLHLHVGHVLERLKSLERGPAEKGDDSGDEKADP